MVTITITDSAFDPENLLSDFRADHGSSGAVASFLGQVRASVAEQGGDAVHSLTLQIYPRMTHQSVQNIADRAITRWPLSGLHITHRYGTMLPGDPIVLVATASAHRRAALEAVDYIMDHLKTEALFWKAEGRADGRHWIEAREHDHEAAQRWEKSGESFL